MSVPLILNNLRYPQPSVTLDNATIYTRFRGAIVGVAAIRGMYDVTISDPRFELYVISASDGFIDAILQLLDDILIDSLDPFDIIFNGTTWLDNSAYSAVVTITPVEQRVPTVRVGHEVYTPPVIPSPFTPTVPPLVVDIQMQIEVMPSGKFMVPGCEPTSALSSTKLSSWMAEAGCKNVLVNVKDALAAIPGSYLKYGANFGRGNMRQTWFVLPPINPECPCDQYPDYYRILRELASEEAPVEEVYDACNISGMGYCPSPDFVEPPPPDPYKEEGTFPAGVGVLPPIPPWGTSGT